jgi:NAD(P)-dependent dehydrogenase (short-subunit alcohol dehydrogenase family)
VIASTGSKTCRGLPTSSSGLSDIMSQHSVSDSAAFVGGLFTLDGRVAVVTGASNGIGRRMVETLARAGAAVVLVARREAELNAVKAGILAGGGRAAAVPADLSDLGGIAEFAKAAATPFGPPDILVNAAGINPRAPANTCTPAQWQQTITLNLSVPFFLAQALVPGMRTRGRGNIINIASLQTWRAFANGIAYGASKGGVGQLTRAMAEAWGHDGITANAIAPGFFPTALTAPVFGNPELAAHHANMTAIGRNGTLADLDGTTIFLASAASAYVTGQIIGVDGGYMAK